MIVEDKARLVSNYMVSKERIQRSSAMDPMTIAAIVAAIMEIIKLLRACYPEPSEKTLDKVRKPGILEGIYLRRTVNRATRRKLRRHPKRAQLTAAIKNGFHNEIAPKMTLHELEGMYREEEESLR